LIHAVLFDHDGVLVDSMPYHVQAWTEVMARHGIEIDPQEIFLQEGATTMEVAAELFHRHRKPASPELVQQIVGEKRDAYLENNQTRLTEGVTDFVEYLQYNRYRLGIVTGSIRPQVESVLAADFLERFDCLITAEDVEYGKPDPEPYIRGAQKLGCTPGSCVVIENAPLGISSAKAAGMGVIAITTTLPPYHLRMADAIVSSFEELRRRFSTIVSNLEYSSMPYQRQEAKPQAQRDFQSMIDTDVDFED